MTMKAFAVTMAVVALLNTAALAQDVPTAPDTPTTVVVTADKPNGRHVWLRAESQNFIVYSDTSRGAVATLLDHLEDFDFVLRNFSGLATDRTAPKTTLYYLSDARDLTAIDGVAPDHAIGLYTSCVSGVTGFAVHGDFKPGDEPVQSQPEDTVTVALFQAYARHFFYSHFPQRTPQWYIEGYASYFSTMRFDGSDAIVGLPSAAFDTYLRNLDFGRGHPQLEWRDVLLDDQTYRPEGIADASLNNDYAHIAARPQREVRGNADLAGQARTSYEYEARAWLLTHWLLSSPDNLPHLQAYLARRDAGDTPLTALKTAFRLSEGGLATTLRDHLHDLTAGRSSLKALPVATITFTDLPAVAENLLLKKAALDTCPAQAQGRQLLADIRGAAASFPDSDLAQSILAQAEVMYGDPATALAWLQARVKTSPQDAWSQALLGQAELAIARNDPGTTQAQESAAAVDAFAEAARLDPQSAAYAYGFARARIFDTGKVDDDAAGAAVLAAQLAPEVDAYAFNAALAYAYAGKRDQAIAMLTPIASDPRAGLWAKPAAAWVVRLKGVATRNDIAAAMLDEGRDAGGAQMEWTLFWPAVLADVRSLDNQQDIADAKAKSDAVLHPGPANQLPKPGQKDASEE